MIELNVREERECNLVEFVRKDGLFLARIQDQTPELCLEAVKENGLALKFVKYQTEEICLAAIKQYSGALEYVKEQTPEICLEALKQNGMLLGIIKEQTPAMCMEAVKQCGYALMYVEDQTVDLCLEAIWNKVSSYEYAKCVNKEITQLYSLLRDIQASNSSPSYRNIRYQLVRRKTNLNRSPYHVLEQLYHH